MFYSAISELSFFEEFENLNKTAIIAEMG